ncbi:MAG: lysophospholipid acyltransferase family protein [Anaerolineae bacterium]
MTDHPVIAYPRRRFVRGVLRGLGRILVPLLTRTEISGYENFPDRGPLLVVGNHIGTMEVVLMVVYAPWQIELLGAGDIAPPPGMNEITQLYGSIPVNRGNFDRRALRGAMSVLRQGGILGVFPEGGVWDPGAMEAKRGVAWLSYHTGTPILPIGFGGVEGALDATFKLRRPRLVMNVGTLMPPVTIPRDQPRREALQVAANEVLNAIDGLIPQTYRDRRPEIAEERFRLELMVRDDDGQKITIPPALEITHADALCTFFYRPWILRIFKKDLSLPVDALQQLPERSSAAALADATDPILRYVEHDNPGFFTYRFGNDLGVAMEAGLRELRALARWAADEGHRLEVHPMRRYRVVGEEEEIIESWPGPPHVW